MTSREVVHDIITRHSTPTVAPSREVFLQAKHSHMKTIYIYSKSEYTNTQQDLLVPKKITSRHARFLASGFVLPKSN
jgi:hypothetical protein